MMSNLVNKKLSQFKKVSLQVLPLFRHFWGFLGFFYNFGYLWLKSNFGSNNWQNDEIRSQLIEIVYFIKMEHPLKKEAFINKILGIA